MTGYNLETLEKSFKTDLIYEIGEADGGFNEKAVMSTFYRLEQKISSTCYEIYDFHTVKNGYLYCKHREQPIGPNGERYDGAFLPDINFGYGALAKAQGNKKYQELKERGFVLVGIYERDARGYIRRIK